MAYEPARVGVPRVASGTVARLGLMARLDERPRLTVVRGRAGLGKSTLVADWLRRAEPTNDVVWVARGARDVTRGDYWAGVLAELGRFGVGSTGFALVEPASSSLRAAFSGLTRPLLLVLDNFGPPGEDWEATARDLVDLLRVAPGLSAIVIGREPTWLESSDAAAGVILLEEDLRLDAAEAHRMAAAAGPGGLPAGELAGLLDSAHGAVLPFRFALEAAARSGPQDQSGAEWSDRLPVDLRRRLDDPDLLEAAGPLAAAPLADAALVAELLGVGAQSAAALLTRLADSGVADLDAHGELTFDREFVAALGDGFRAAHPGRAAAADVVIARWLRERGDGTAAIPFALRGRDLDLAADLLVTHFVEFDLGDLGTLTDLVAQVSQADLEANPGLLVIGSLLRAAYAPDRAGAREAFAAAVHAARSRRQPGMSARRRFELACGEAIAQRALGRASESVGAVRDALAAARDMSHGERTAMGTAYPMLLGQAGLSAFWALAPSLAHACFNAELAASRRITFGRRRNVALANLAMLAVLGGRMRRAERLLAEIVDADWALERPAARPSAPYAIAAAYIALNRGEAERARRLLDEHAGDRPPASENWALTAVARALAGMLAGASGTALAELVAADAAHGGPGERAAAEAAGVQATVELLELATSERVVRPASDVRVNGRAAVLLLTARAIRAALSGRSGMAGEYLARAARFGGSPIQDLWASMAAVIAAGREGGDIRDAAERIARIVTADGLRWPLAILSEAQRAEVLAALDGTDLADGLRIAFERTPASVRLASMLTELHPRELAVLRDLAETGSRTELAERSCVSINTIKTQLRSLYRKLEVSGRDDALARAAELGLLDAPDSA